MVAFTIDSATANKLKVKDGEDVSDMHVTLVYIKEIDNDQIKALTTMLKGFAGTFAPIDATLRGPTRFSATKHSDGKDVCVAAVESLSLHKFREDLLNKVESLGIEVSKNFSYNPHVTLKYINPKDDLPVQRIDPIEVTFKSITLYDQGETTDFPLSGTAIAKSSGYGTIIECVSEGDLMWAHVSQDDGNRVSLQFNPTDNDIQVGDHVRWDDDNGITLDNGQTFYAVNISKATGSKEGQWVTINGQHILVGSDGKPLAGNPKVLGQRNVSAKVETARKNAVLTGKHEQDIADRSEVKISKALDIPRTKNNSAYDLRNDEVGIELKTMVTGKNDKVTMGKEALGRKLAEQRAEGLKVFTVVADMRGRTQAKYYVREGLGSFRVGSMTPASLSEIKEMVTR
jgi:2'-5' RNA ligase